MSKQSHPLPSERKQPASRLSHTAMHVFTESLSIPKQTPEPEQKTVQQKPNEVRFVRFLLSPTPEESMADEGRPIRDRKQTVFYPTDPKVEEPSFKSVNKWGRKQLDLLGVQFVPNAKKRLDLNKVLNINENEWPPAIQQRVAECKEQLAAVDVERLKSEENFDDYSMRELAPDFGDSFAALSALMTSKDTKLQTEKTVTSSTQEPKTPDQPTRPSDPNRTKDTSSTGDSQGEPTTKKLLDDFLCETLAALKREFVYINWQQSGHRMHLYQTGSDNMKFTLGTETVNPINDGGLRIRHKIGIEQTDFRLRGVRPVLSLEAKRRKSKRRDDPNLPWDYAGQIFAEMLGQVCYEDFYKNPDMDYQEAFVIHGSHSSITIYYCKFPNQYLSEISRFGKNFLTKRTFKVKVKLLRTRKFSFRDTNDRVELFGLLAKLLWYLVSGGSRVGYLYNYPDNPLHTIGKVIHDSIAVEDSRKLLPAVKLGAEGDDQGDDSISLERVADEEGNDSNESFSASEAGGDVAATGGLDSAGEEEEEEDETEGEPMDLS